MFILFSVAFTHVWLAYLDLSHQSELALATSLHFDEASVLNNIGFVEAIGKKDLWLKRYPLEQRVLGSSPDLATVTLAFLGGATTGCPSRVPLRAFALNVPHGN